MPAEGELRKRLPVGSVECDHHGASGRPAQSIATAAMGTKRGRMSLLVASSMNTSRVRGSSGPTSRRRGRIAEESRSVPVLVEQEFSTRSSPPTTNLATRSLQDR